MERGENKRRRKKRIRWINLTGIEEEEKKDETDFARKPNWRNVIKIGLMNINEETPIKMLKKKWEKYISEKSTKLLTREKSLRSA